MQRSRLTWCIVASVLLIAGCDVTSLTDDVEDALKVIVNVPPVETITTLRIVDAATGQAPATEVTVQFTGTNADLVVDQFTFDAISSVTSTTGLITFAFPDGLTYSSDQPFMVTARISAEGYLSSNVSMRIDETGRFEFQGSLIERSMPPAGIVVDSQSSGSTDNTGTTQSEATVQTAPDPTTGGSVSVQIPAGTQVTGANGQPLQGALTTTVVYNSTQTTQAAAVAGNTTQNATVVNADGSSGQATIVPLATVQIEITDQNGNQAANLSTPLVLQVPIADNALNASGQPLQAGDSVPVFGYDASADTWTALPPGRVAGKSDARAGVVVQTSDGLSIEFTLDELNAFTEFTFGQFYAPSQLTEINLTLGGKELYSYVYITGTVGGISVGIGTTEQVLTVENVPRDVLPFTTVELTAEFEGEIVNVGGVAFTSTASENMTMPLDMPSDLVNITVAPSIDCSVFEDLENQEIRPDITLNYWLITGPENVTSPKDSPTSTRAAIGQTSSLLPFRVRPNSQYLFNVESADGTPYWKRFPEDQDNNGFTPTSNTTLTYTLSNEPPPPDREDQRTDLRIACEDFL